MRLQKRKMILPVLLTLSLLLAGCGKQEANYRDYLLSYLSACYSGNTEDYTRYANTNAKTAAEMNRKMQERLADNLCRIYAPEILSDALLYEKMVELAALIYSKADFEVSEPREENGGYYLDVRIRPMDILNTSAEEIRQYAEEYNSRIDAGEFNDMEKEDFQKQFSEGLIERLKHAAENMTYRDQVTVTAEIVPSGSSFSVSDESITAIDRQILVTKQ